MASLDIATMNAGTKKKFETFVTKNDWISNEDFEHEVYPDHPWFRIDRGVINRHIGEASTKIAGALGVIPKEDIELRHLERNALELRHVHHGPAKKILFMGSADKPSRT